MIRIAHVTESTMVITRVSHFHRLLTYRGNFGRFLSVAYTSRLRLHVRVLQVSLHMNLFRHLYGSERDNYQYFLRRRIAIVPVYGNVSRRISHVVRHRRRAHRLQINGHSQFALFRLFRPRESREAPTHRRVTMTHTTSHHLHPFTRLASFNSHRLFRRHLKSPRHVSQVDDFVHERGRRVLRTVLSHKGRRILHPFRVHANHFRQGRLTAKGLFRNHDQRRVIRAPRHRVRQYLVARVPCVRLRFKVLRLVARVILLFLVATGSASLLGVKVRGAPGRDIAREANASNSRRNFIFRC